jgi:hypothetical protein
MDNVDRDNQKSRKSSHLKNHHSIEEEVRIPVSASAPVPLGEMTTVLRIQRVPKPYSTTEVTKQLSRT